jgi:hypothetical protein
MPANTEDRLIADTTIKPGKFPLPAGLNRALTVQLWPAGKLEKYEAQPFETMLKPFPTIVTFSPDAS